MIGSSVLLGAVFVAIGYLVSALVRGPRHGRRHLALGIWLLLVLIYDMALLGVLALDQGRNITGERAQCLLLLNPTDAYRLLNLTGFANVSAFAGMAGLAQSRRLTVPVLLAALAAGPWCRSGSPRSPSPGGSYETPIHRLRSVAAACARRLQRQAGGEGARRRSEMTAEAIGHYCGMNVLEHPGPKGQIFVASLMEPVWFSSARDTLAFTMLPEEPKDIQAIYVSDMGKAPSWDKPGADNWVEARRALFVIGSRIESGMGADEAVPFSDRTAAEKFAAENGGRIVGFDEVPRGLRPDIRGRPTAALRPTKRADGPPGVQLRRTR